MSRLWDIFLTSSSYLIFHQAALAILSLSQPIALNFTCLEDAFVFYQSPPAEVLAEDVLLAVAVSVKVEDKYKCEMYRNRSEI